MPPRLLFAPLLATLALALAPAARAAPAFDLGAYKGKVVMLDFWASWCQACEQSFPWMEDVQETYGRQGLQIIAVNVDHAPAAGQRFLQNHSSNFKVIYDPKGDLAKIYKISGMPMSILIGRDGRVRFSHSGFYEKKESAYESQISQLLSEAAP